MQSEQTIKGKIAERKRSQTQRKSRSNLKIQTKPKEQVAKIAPLIANKKRRKVSQNRYEPLTPEFGKPEVKDNGDEKPNGKIVSFKEKSDKILEPIKTTSIKNLKQKSDKKSSKSPKRNK